jgi:hypothetical protein
MQSRSRFALYALLLILLLPIASFAQSPAESQCGQYVEAYQGGAPAYTPYLQATEQVAKSRDAQQGSTRYVPALRNSAPAANALWLNNWCTKNPLKGFSEASSRLLDELTGQAAPSPSPSPQVVIVTPRSAAPSACKVGDNGVCSGCSVSCGNGTIAKCKQGSTTADGQRCAFTSRCECNQEKNAPPPADLADGPSACKVGDNGACSGCSVSCTNGKTATCKQGSLMADGQSCAFQSKCQCK